MGSGSPCSWKRKLPRFANTYASNFVAIAQAVRAKHPKLDLILGCESQEEMLNMLKLRPEIGKLANQMTSTSAKAQQNLLQRRTSLIQFRV